MQPREARNDLKAAVLRVLDQVPQVASHQKHTHMNMNHKRPVNQRSVLNKSCWSVVVHPHFCSHLVLHPPPSGLEAKLGTMEAHLTALISGAPPTQALKASVSVSHDTLPFSACGTVIKLISLGFSG